MPPGLRVDVEELRLDVDHLRLDGRAPTYEAVDSLRRALAASPRLRDVGTEDVHATIDGARVVFRLRARWIPRGEAAS
jgi:Tfp pilus assembly protein PilN